MYIYIYMSVWCF